MIGIGIGIIIVIIIIIVTIGIVIVINRTRRFVVGADTQRSEFAVVRDRRLALLLPLLLLHSPRMSGQNLLFRRKSWIRLVHRSQPWRIPFWTVNRPVLACFRAVVGRVATGCRSRFMLRGLFGGGG